MAFGTALDTFGEVGFDAIAQHEQRLLRRTLDGLAQLPKVTVYGDTEDIADKVGVITFNVEGVDAADVAKQLADGRGVAVRQGEFCAHPYCHRLLGVSDEETVAGMQTDGFAPPAMVRISFGMYNDETEVDALLLMVAGTVIGSGIMHLLGFSSPISTEKLAQIALGKVTAQEVTGVPDYISCASNYIMFIGIWVVFVLAFAIPRANRKMLQKLILIRDGRSLKLFGLGALAGLSISAWA